MAKIIGMQKKPDTTELTLELDDIELKSLNLNNPVMVLSQDRLDLKATTHQVPSKSGKSTYILVPASLKKKSKSIPLKEKQQFKCGLIETAEGGYLVYQYDK